MISRDESREIGKSALQEHGFTQGTYKVYALDEIPWAKPNLYEIDLKCCWIVYSAPELSALTSSLIVVIKKDTGQIVYYGSAHDEG